jgi:hypothetical protein
LGMEQEVFLEIKVNYSAIQISEQCLGCHLAPDQFYLTGIVHFDL